MVTSTSTNSHSSLVQYLHGLHRGLPKAQGKDIIFVVVDRLTKYAHFFPLSHPYTSAEVAHLFLKKVVKLHEFPSTIVSDRDQLFLSNFLPRIVSASRDKIEV